MTSTRSIVKKKYVLALNELSLHYVLLNIILRRDTIYIPMPCIFGEPGSRLIRLLTKRLDSHRFQSVFDCHPSLHKFHEQRVPRHDANPFSRSEACISNEYSFGQALKLGEDSYPYKQLVSIYCFSYYDSVWLIQRLQKLFDHERLIILGLPRTAQTIYRAVYQSQPLPISSTYLAIIFRPVINFSVLSLVFIQLILHIIRTSTFCRPTIQFYSLGADYIDHPFDYPIYSLAPADQKVFLLHRTPATTDSPRDKLTRAFESGVFGRDKTDILYSLSLFIRSLFPLVRNFTFVAHKEPSFVRRVLQLPLIRLKTRQSLVYRRFKVFFARDDYSVNHIIRSQELKAYRTKTIGLMHGLPVSATVVPMCRYIMLDVYFVIGLGISKYYKDTWPASMSVIASGIMNPIAVTSPCDTARTSIIFQAKPNINIASLKDTLRLIHHNLPEYTIYVCVKGSFSRSQLALDFINYASTIDSVRVTSASIYSIFPTAKYLISDPSTVVAEAIPYGTIPLVLETDSRESLYLRDFPNLCFKHPSDLINALLAYENNTVNFDPAVYADLIALDKNFLDLISKELQTDLLTPSTI